MNINDELKNCPFCGVLPTISYVFGKPVISCRNSKCVLKPSTYLNKENKFEKLVLAWNTRKEKE